MIYDVQFTICHWQNRKVAKIRVEVVVVICVATLNSYFYKNIFKSSYPLSLQPNKLAMKNTPFTHKHIELGAKMAEFAGYNMPISYTGINDEHFAVRNSVGVFDVSHMGEFMLKGNGALDLIQRVTSNDASKLTNGKAQYSCLPNDNGGIVDDLLVNLLASLLVTR